VKKSAKFKQCKYEFAFSCRCGVFLEEGIPTMIKHMSAKRYRTGYG